MWKLPRGMVIGKVEGDSRFSEAEHFWKCEFCSGLFDMRVPARCSIMRDRTRRPRHVTGWIWMGDRRHLVSLTDVRLGTA